MNTNDEHAPDGGEDLQIDTPVFFRGTVDDHALINARIEAPSASGDALVRAAERYRRRVSRHV